MTLIQRALRICTQPEAEWRSIAAEATSPSQVIFGYVLPLSLAGAMATMLGWMAFGPVFNDDLGISRWTPIRWTLVGVAVTLGACAITALVINGLAPTFQGTPDRQQAFKAAGYAWTPVLLFNLLRIIPMMGILGVIGLLFSLFLLYVGLPIVMKSPRERAVPYALAIAAIGFVATMVMTALIGMLFLFGSLFTDEPFRIV